ncbi:MAG: hypothetical protein BIFFINMI_04154 [Phycisphaerae bacterium]|nr:hypothetical protein [Phycisphaerae bacterium]
MWSLLASAAIEEPRQAVEAARKAIQDAGGMDLVTGKVQAEQWFWEHVGKIHYVAAGAIIVLGIVYLLYGWKFYKACVILNAAAIGAGAGKWLSDQYKIEWWIIPVAAAVVAIIAWPLMKYSVCVMAGLAGALLGALIWRALTLPDNILWAGSAIGLVALGLLGLIVFRATIIVFTTLQGASFLLTGAVALVVRYKNISDPIRQTTMDKPFMIPAAVFVLALIGLIFQFTRESGGPAPE